MLKVVVSFLVGAAAGAAAALLLAPSSGDELRSQLYDVAEADRERMRSEYQRGMNELQARMDKLSSDISGSFAKGKEAASDKASDVADDMSQLAEDVQDLAEDAAS